jgi:hypothetical protein
MADFSTTAIALRSIASARKQEKRAPLENREKRAPLKNREKLSSYNQGTSDLRAASFAWRNSISQGFCLALRHANRRKFPQLEIMGAGRAGQ